MPFAIADATTLTEAGYVGEDVENILLKLITAADGDVQRAQVGIVYIDEIDKRSRARRRTSPSRVTSGEGVRQALLKILEGTDASVPPQGGRKHPQQELIHINTNNILFICGGAFVGLDKIVADRIGKKGIGFNAELGKKVEENEDELMAQVMPQDLHKFGMIPEFIGRIPVITSTHELTEDDLVEILTKPRNAIVKQYRRMFELEGVSLEFEPDALREVARQAIARGTGARGLRAICEATLEETMFDLPSDLDITDVVVTKGVRGRLRPATAGSQGAGKHRASWGKTNDSGERGVRKAVWPGARPLVIRWGRRLRELCPTASVTSMPLMSVRLLEAFGGSPIHLAGREGRLAPSAGRSVSVSLSSGEADARTRAPPGAEGMGARR